MRAREGAQVALVPIDRLRAHPRNVRHDLGDLRELADSIANEGVLVPVMAERRGDVLRLLHGHRRVEAARQAWVAYRHRAVAPACARRGLASEYRVTETPGAQVFFLLTDAGRQAVAA